MGTSQSVCLKHEWRGIEFWNRGKCHRFNKDVCHDVGGEYKILPAQVLGCAGAKRFVESGKPIVIPSGCSAASDDPWSSVQGEQLNRLVKMACRGGCCGSGEVVAVERT